MPYDAKAELKKVTDFYNQDPMQKRFSAIVSGATNSGKSFLFKTARMPVHIDSFDPGGTKCLLYDPKNKEMDRKICLRTVENPEGQIIADTSWETEDPFKPKAYAEWKKVTKIRKQIGYFNTFGTYGLDSLTTFSSAVMNSQLASKGDAGNVPQHRRDYNPQKVEIENQIRDLMNLSCDFILTGHLERLEELKSIDKTTGIKYQEVEYRLMITGKAVITVPLLFDELYVLRGDGEPPRREMVIDASGKFLARSRLKGGGRLKAVEEPNIKELLKKVGLSWEDKPRLSFK